MFVHVPVYALSRALVFPPPDHAVDGLLAVGGDLLGVLLMLATPVVRVLVAGVLFLREKDWRYGAISFGVLTILLLSAVFGIGEH